MVMRALKEAQRWLRIAEEGLLVCEGKNLLKSVILP